MRTFVDSTELEARIDGQAVSDALATPIWILDAVAVRVVWANTAAVRLFGEAGVERLLERDLGAEMAPGERLLLDQRLERLERTEHLVDSFPILGVSAPTCVYSRFAGGGQGWLLIETLPGAARTHYEALEQRARQQERALEALELDRRFASSVFESAGSLLVVSDLGGEIVSVNRALCQLLGKAAEELRGRAVWEFLMDNEAEVVRRALAEHRASLDAVIPKRVDAELRTESGEPRLITWQNTLILDDEGRSRFVVAAGTDLTGRREMQAQLQISDRMASIGTLAGGVAHGINNPLAYVIANLHHARERLETTLDHAGLAELKELLDETLHGANRVRRIVGDLATFSQDEDERVMAVDLHQIVERALDMAANEIRRRARVTRRFGVVPRVLGTESKLGQVVVNLLVNAAQAIEPGQVEENSIDVSTSLDRHGRPKLEIRDTGVGIPPENLNKIFDPFFTTKPLGVGTGLGLSIAHRVISEFGGEIAVLSRFGQGTTVSVTLQEAPHDRESAPKPSTLPPPSVLKPRLRILIVDDEPAILRALQRLLSSHEVFRAASGREAVERVEQIGPFDVIFCDVMMPELSGLDVYRRVSELRPGQEHKIIFVTGGAFADHVARFLDSIPNPKLSKPFEPGAVRDLIKSLSA